LLYRALAARKLQLTRDRGFRLAGENFMHVDGAVHQGHPAKLKNLIKTSKI